MLLFQCLVPSHLASGLGVGVVPVRVGRLPAVEARVGVVQAHWQRLDLLHLVGALVQQHRGLRLRLVGRRVVIAVGLLMVAAVGVGVGVVRLGLVVAVGLGLVAVGLGLVAVGLGLVTVGLGLVAVGLGLVAVRLGSVGLGGGVVVAVAVGGGLVAVCGRVLGIGICGKEVRLIFEVAVAAFLSAALPLVADVVDDKVLEAGLLGSVIIVDDVEPAAVIVRGRAAEEVKVKAGGEVLDAAAAAAATSHIPHRLVHRGFVGGDVGVVGGRDRGGRRTGTEKGVAVGRGGQFVRVKGRVEGKVAGAQLGERV